MKTAALLAIFCCVHLASGVIHSYQYIYTTTSGIKSIPEFIVVGSVDGQPIGYFDSEIKKMIPKQEWVLGAVDANFWKRNGDNFAGTHPVHVNNIVTAKERFNQTGGVHTFQQLYGCQWDDAGGATNGYQQYGYDGEDFISLDLENKRWIAPTKQSEITKNKWDADKARLEYLRNYYTKECIDWLKKYVQYGSSTLGRKVSPKATLLQKGSEVVCHATGFYPDAVMITWKKDGEEMQDDVDVGETLPNEDGTFQKRAVLTVSPEERKKAKYSCEVSHKSGETIVMIFEEANHLPIIIAVCVIAAAALVVGIVAFVIVKKRGYTKAPQSDTSSDTTDETPKA